MEPDSRIASDVQPAPPKVLSPEEAARLADGAADEIIRAMVVGAVGAAVVPVYVNWAILASALGVGVASIGGLYGYSLTKDEGWKVAKTLLLSGGTLFLAFNFGSKFIAGILTATGIGHIGAMALDGAVSAATAYAIGGAAKEYFKGERNKARLGEILRSRFAQARQSGPSGPGAP